MSSTPTLLPLISHTNETTNSTLLSRSATCRLVTYPTETGLTSLINSSINSHSHTNTASRNIYNNMSNIEKFSNDDEFPCQYNNECAL